jgi:hypothetical protein
MPIDLDQLVAHKGEGQSGVNYTDPDGSPRGTRWSTMPMMYDNCWGYGAYTIGSTARFDWAAGVTLGSPGAPVDGPDTNSGVALHGKLGFAPVAGLALHLSLARGAYLAEDVVPYLPPGARLEDYAQSLVGGSVEWGFRKLTLHSELFWNHCETPLRSSGLASTSAYLEAVYKFLPGWYAAGRFDTVRFEAVETSTGRETWDQNTDRIELGVGYHVSRELMVKAVGQLNDTGSGFDVDQMLPALQVSFKY